ncbi:MAG: Asp23/Gls24 family envelope stress response protein [Lentisphaeria bacterium]|nr:Asp23/Gls24 family envelope stress response protein [Lentisphaeria bacterium]
MSPNLKNTPQTQEDPGIPPVTEAQQAAEDPGQHGEADGGAIQISENVIAAVVRKFTLEVDGVVRFAPGGIVGGIAGMIAKRNYESSMIIDLDEDAVNISVTLVMRFGVRIPEVAQAVQEIIRAKVEELTGKHVTRVNIQVQDLEEAQAPAPEPALPIAGGEAE